MKVPAEYYKPNPITSEVKSRLQRFEQLNAFVTKHNGWITSPPGEREVRIECLPETELPDELRAAGYEVQSAGAGERILRAFSLRNLPGR